MANRIEPQAEPIPGYRLIERLGGGGFGEVWKAEAPGGLLKAIKFVYGDLEMVDNDETVRANQELRSLERVRSVRHPFILSLERYEVINGQLIIVTELADRNLWDRFRECRNQGLKGIPKSELFNYVKEAAEALDLMNLQYDLMHLDIKPQNLFLVHNHIKVADFGLVKDLEGLVASVTGGITPVYASPETFEGYVSRYSDQYSLAIVFQELLTGYRPFMGTNTRQLIMQHLEGKPKLDPLPEELRPIVARALNRDPNQRFSTCMEFIQTIQQSVQGSAVQPAYRPSQETPQEMPSPLAAQDGVKSEAVPDGSPSRSSAVTPMGTAQSFPSVHSTQLASDSASFVFSPTSRSSAHRQPPSQRTEQTGSGILVPALIIGLGQMGRVIVNQLRQEWQLRYPLQDSLPHIKTYCIDTDPQTPPMMVGTPTAASEEVIVTKLNRPTRYIRPRDTLPPVESWLDTNILYRMPRTFETNGIRAFGRLAFIEYSRGIASRIRRDLEHITAPETMTEAEQHTSLKLRSNFPRVYVICSLSGGTGSGMFIDLAYVVKQQLRDIGFPRQDVIGIFLIPSVGDQGQADMPQANAFASLRELHHYMVARQPFRALYETGCDPLVDNEPPFSQAFLLPLPDSKDLEQLQETLKVSSGFLHRSLLTPLGKTADQFRAKHSATASPFHSVGIRVLASPRRPLLRRAAKRLGLLLIENWLRPSSLDLEVQVAQDIQAFFVQERMDPTNLYEQLETAVTSELGKSFASFIREMTEPFMQLPVSGYPDNREIKQVFKKVEEWLGIQGEAPSTTLTTPHIVRILHETSENLARQAGPPLVQHLVSFIDRPGFRMAGAEEAIRQAMGCLDAWHLIYEEQIKQLITSMHDQLTHLKNDLGDLDRLRVQGAKRKTPLPIPLGERMRKCFTFRYQQLIYDRIIALLVCFRGFCSDQVKEMRFCRNRLAELSKGLRDVEDPGALSSLKPGFRQTSSILLPRGCVSLVHAVTEFLSGVGPAELSEFDLHLQKVLNTSLPPLGKLCLSPGDSLRPVHMLLNQEAERYLEQRIDILDAAGLYLERQGDEQTLADALTTTFDETLPLMLNQRINFSQEFSLLILPDSPSGELMEQACSVALPDTHVVLSPQADELVLYREVVGIPLQDLKIMGPAARVAYDTAMSIEHFTPHSRQDVPHWLGPGS